MAMETIRANGYTFTIDTDKGTTTAAGELLDVKAGRNVHLQSKAGGELREPTDQGGHLVAAQHNGPPISANLFAQDGRLNQGVFKTVENTEHRLISAPQGKAGIHTERTAFISSAYTGNGIRPDAFMLHDTITYADGKTQDIHLSFANMSVQEQEGINHALETNILIEDMPNPGDALREFMSPEEYARLMEETDAALPNIRDEFDEHITNDNLGAIVEGNTDEADINDESTVGSWNLEMSQGDAIEASVGDNWGYEAECESAAETDIGVDDGIDSSFGEE